MRGDLRFDMAIKSGELSCLHGTDRAWLPVVEAALGPGYRLIHMVSEAAFGTHCAASAA